MCRGGDLPPESAAAGRGKPASHVLGSKPPIPVLGQRPSQDDAAGSWCPATFLLSLRGSPWRDTQGRPWNKQEEGGTSCPHFHLRHSSPGHLVSGQGKRPVIQAGLPHGLMFIEREDIQSQSLPLAGWGGVMLPYPPPLPATGLCPHVAPHPW